jgi:hypothetical protein
VEDQPQCFAKTRPPCFAHRINRKNSGKIALTIFTAGKNGHSGGKNTLRQRRLSYLCEWMYSKMFHWMSCCIFSPEWRVHIESLRLAVRRNLVSFSSFLWSGGGRMGLWCRSFR